jgi:hypothetical protein
MKRSTKIGLIISGSTIVLTIVIFCITIFFWFIFPIVKQLRAGRGQMMAGQNYMNSLTEKDFQIWTGRTQRYLSNFNRTNWMIEIESIPMDLRELKILSIYVEGTNSVDYVWMGGFDHTMLHVDRLKNGQYVFTAIYSDQSNRLIWPKNAAP